MHVYSELVAPSAVTHSLSLPLTSATASNLVVAKGSLLQIFTTVSLAAELDSQSHGPQSSIKDDTRHFHHRVNDDDGGLEASFLGGESMIVKADRATHTKLVLVAEFPLAGTIVGLARVKLKDTASGGEALLLAYKAAKLCLTEWDPRRNTLETASIHYYEKDELLGAPWEMGFGEYVNHLEADPSSRCVAFKFGSRNLAILPLAGNEDDLELDDWDEDLDGPRPIKEPSTVTTNGDSEHSLVKPRYTPSFVLRLPLLDPSLLHPVHLAFLHEYREPTFGILSSAQPPSATLGIKDNLSYKVFTLDLQQRASTTILSVTGLPRDLFKVVALPAPLGGALLVGENELVHVDQSGKASGVAVNDMAKQITSFSLVDQSDLGLRLEGCVVELLAADAGELMLILNDGRLCLICFKVDGRTVSGLSLKLVAAECGGKLIKSRVSCVSKLGMNAVFLGSESNDSIVLGWSRKHSQEKKKKSRLLDPEIGLELDDLELDDDEDDDLYGNGSSETKPSQHTNGTSRPGDLTFRIHDELLSIAPVRDFVCGKPASASGDEDEALAQGVKADLELVCAVGTSRAGSVAILNRQIQPKVIGRFDFPEARGFWTMCVKKPLPKSLGPNVSVSRDYDTTGQYDKYMIVAKVDLDGYETSDVYALTAAGFETLKDTEFEPAAGFTVEAGTMGKQMRIIQVLRSEVRCYDGDLGLSQILPMLDEDTGAEPRVTSASIVDPYLLLVRDDSSVFIAQIDANNELEEEAKPEGVLKSTKWSSGCLYNDMKGVFQAQTGKEDTEESGHRIVMFLLSSAGALHVYALPNLSDPVFVAEALTSVPPYLSADFVARKGASKESIAEILVADLGDAVEQSPYLIVRLTTDDLVIYEPIRYQRDTADSTLSATLLFKKLSNPALARTAPEASEEDVEEPPRFVPLRRCTNVNGHSTVFLASFSPSFVLKSSKSSPRVVGLEGLGVRGMSPFHTEGCDQGFIYVDTDGIARVTQLPADTNLTELGLSVKKIALESDTNMISYHHPTGAYIAACSTSEPFELPKDDDYHKEWAKESVAFPPTVPRGVLKLLNPLTWTVVQTVDMEQCEAIGCMKTLHLEVSEETKERKMLVTVGSALAKGEDLPTRGRLRVFDVVTVVPEPGRPETDKKLKLMGKEEIARGAVTALSEIGEQGLMLVAQGQKCMVRGLKEDGSLLPVAFLDMSCHVSGVKALAGTGLCVMADAFKGLWFAGYTEEPYTFKVLGKSSGSLRLLAADFVPDGEDLSMVAVDADGELHVFEFNPEHPKSLQGHLLLHQTSFSVTPNTPTTTLLLPRTFPPAAAAQPPGHILLMACPSGQLASLAPLSESTYRRLLSVTNQLHPAVVPYGGLHTKNHRLAHSDQSSSAGVETASSSGRALVDATVLSRWNELSAAKRAEVATRGGYDSAADFRDELEGVLGWTGLAYF